MRSSVRKEADTLFDNQEKLLTYEELSEFLQITDRTLRRWVAKREIPFRKIGARAVRFSKSEVEAWLNKRRPR